VYAHNWQDYRRKPYIYSYRPSQCSSWNTQDKIVEYKDACPNGLYCQRCHGWKELEFHPLNYKRHPCPTNNCSSLHCPKYHKLEERREPRQFFLSLPKCRTTFFPSTYYLPHLSMQKKLLKEVGSVKNTALTFLLQDFRRAERFSSGNIRRVPRAQGSNTSGNSSGSGQWSINAANQHPRNKANSYRSAPQHPNTSEDKYPKQGPQSARFNMHGPNSFNSGSNEDDDSSDFELRRTSRSSESDSEI